MLVRMWRFYRMRVCANRWACVPRSIGFRVRWCACVCTCMHVSIGMCACVGVPVRVCLCHLELDLSRSHTPHVGGEGVVERNDDKQSINRLWSTACQLFPAVLRRAVTWGIERWLEAGSHEGLARFRKCGLIARYPIQRSFLLFLQACA